MIDLVKGFARIEFNTGAVLTLQGPAQLVLNQANGVLLRHGTLNSDVPKPARGFTVETASSRIVDFGTEFGVSVDPAGATALSVFQGIVEVARRGADAAQGRRIRAGQSVRLDDVGGRRGAERGRPELLRPRPFRVWGSAVERRSADPCPAVSPRQ